MFVFGIGYVPVCMVYLDANDVQKTSKLYHKIQAGDGAITCVQWHPQESSKVVTAGLDGLIKYWD